MGDVQLELYWDHAPKASPNSLVQYQRLAPDPAAHSTDMQKLCRARKKRLLQWGDVPPHHRRTSFFFSSRARIAFDVRPGFHDSRWGSDGDGTGWDEYIRAAIVRLLFLFDADVDVIPAHSEDEIHPELRFTGAGILAMANSGPNTNGTSTRHCAILGTNIPLTWPPRLPILHHPRPDALPR